MRCTFHGPRQTNPLGVQHDAVNTPFNPRTTLMAALVILRLSAGAVFILIGVLAYAVVNAGVRGLFLLFAAGTLGCCWLLYQVIGMTTTYAKANRTELR
jgi:uncharacterized membrane protein YqjE